MADRRNIVFPLIFFLWIVLSPDPRPPAVQLEAQKRIHDVIAQEQFSLGVLQNSSYGDLRAEPLADVGYGLNLTGVEADRGFAWDALARVKERAREQLEYALGDSGLRALENGSDGLVMPPLYANVTGHVQGRWVRSKLDNQISPPPLNLSKYAVDGPFGSDHIPNFRKNISDSSGELSLQFHERSENEELELDLQAANATRINVEMGLSIDESGDEWEMLLRGVYYKQLGQAVLTTTSDKYAGIFLLPHFALSARSFAEAKVLVNDTIARTIQSQINGRIDSLTPWSASTAGFNEPLIPQPTCDLIMYLQQLPPTSPGQPYSPGLISSLERELRFPTGAVLPQAPQMRFSMLAFSPDCGYVIESKGEPNYSPQEGGTHLAGLKIQLIFNQGRHHLLFFAVCLGTQLALLMSQMREASTPSTRSRISFYTIAMLAMGDGFTFMSLCLTSWFIASLWVNLTVTAFFSFLSVSFFGMRFLMDIWAVQAPERARRERERLELQRRRLQEATAFIQASRERRLAAQEAEGRTHEPASDNNAPTAEHQTTGEDRPSPTERVMPGTLPLPVTARPPVDTGSVPVFMPSDQEGLEPIETRETPATTINPPPERAASSFGALYTRFYLLLLATLFISLNASTWPSVLRRIYFTTLALAYLSFWIPQIHRNVQRNCRRALLWKFVLGQSTLRLAPFAYFYTYKDNVLWAETDYKGFSVLVLWVWIQVVILASQEIVGPRWFVKKTWAPPAYDYHPILRLDEEGATLPLGLSQASLQSPTQAAHERRASVSSTSPSARRASIAKDSKEKGKRVFDCAICMQELEAPIIEADGRGGETATGSASSLLARRMYMVTPCRHIFHSACLEGWMKYRLQCPICREGLPPL